MYSDENDFCWEPYPAAYKTNRKPKRYQYTWEISEDSFQCLHCHSHISTQSMISGVKNRNHCPYCLWSKHVDLYKPGDRLSACKSQMQPIGLTIKRSNNKYGDNNHGELMLLHLCMECGKICINRIAADDCTEKMLDIFHSSCLLDSSIKRRIQHEGICLLDSSQQAIVYRSLFGN